MRFVVNYRKAHFYWRCGGSMAETLLAILCMMVIPFVAVLVISALIVAGRADRAQGDD